MTSYNRSPTDLTPNFRAKVGSSSKKGFAVEVIDTIPEEDN